MDVTMSDDNLQLVLTRKMDDEASATTTRTGTSSTRTTTTKTNDNSMTKGSHDLYLSYGMSQFPARFLVVFGFCDETSPYIDAHIPIHTSSSLLLSNDKDVPLATNADNDLSTLVTMLIDPMQLVISTKDGVIAEDVWYYFLLQVLSEKDPSKLQDLMHTIEKITNDDDDDNDYDDDDIINENILEELLDQWEFVVAQRLQIHIDMILEQYYPPISKEDDSRYNNVPERNGNNKNNGSDDDGTNMSMILSYHTYVRNIFLKAKQHVESVLEQLVQLQQLQDQRKKFHDEETIEQGQEKQQRQQQQRQQMMT